MSTKVKKGQVTFDAEGTGQGVKAKEFVEKHNKTIGKITRIQQVYLFENIYLTYESLAKQNYNKWTATEKGRVEWNKLDQAIRDVLVDFVYQGFTQGPNPMKAGMNNDFEELIKYIDGTAAIKQYGPGRNRAKYLKSRKPVKNPGATK
jgi:hypothetical protein